MPLDYKKEIQLTEDRLKELYQNRRDNPSSNEYDIEIRKLEGQLVEFNEKQGQKEIVSNSTKQLPIICYVITSTKRKIEQNLGCECFGYLEEDRYHDSDCKSWRPYDVSKSISIILADFRRNYPFEEKYLDGQTDDNIFAHIDDNITNSFAIIDLLALYDNNYELAIRFDRKDSSVFTPICISLHSEVRAFANSKIDKFKTLRGHSNKDVPCNLYSHMNISGYDNFKYYLKMTLASKFITQKLEKGQMMGFN